MNMLKKLGWAAVLVTSGLPHSAVVPHEAAAGAAGAPVAPAGGDSGNGPDPATQPARWPWPFAGEDEDLGDDEFEGEGWTFWGV
jgi:hypothetical protein